MSEHENEIPGTPDNGVVDHDEAGVVEEHQELPVEDRTVNQQIPVVEDDLDVPPPLEDQVEEVEEPAFPLSNPNVNLREAATKPLKQDPGKVPAYLLVPQTDIPSIEEIIRSLPQRELGGQAKVWLQYLHGSASLIPRDGQFNASQFIEGSNWTQGLDHEGRNVNIGMPRAGQVAAGTVLTGSDATLHMARQLGMYAHIQIPLYHTGIWIDVKVPSDGELALLEQRISSATYELGYQTKGLAYSNTSVKMNMEVVDFILDRVVATTAREVNKQYLKSIIRTTDIGIMAWAMANAVYPAGFPYGRACSADPVKCTHVVREMLRLSKLIWTDSSAFTDWQKKLLASRGTKKITEEDLEKYQSEFVRIGARRVKVRDGIHADLRVPTLLEYEQAGYEWIDSLIAQAKASLDDLSTQEMNQVINEQYQLSSMQQYTHWVASLYYSDGDLTVEGREEISNSLKMASANEEIVETFTKEIKKYIDDVSATIIAIPKYDCPSCGAPAGQDTTHHPFLVALDPVQAFFILRDLKIQTTLNANMVY